MSDVVVKIAYTDSCDLVALGSVERGTMIVTRERGSIVSVAVAPEDCGELVSSARAVAPPWASKNVSVGAMGESLRTTKPFRNGCHDASAESAAKL